jgi:nickel-dependent lactate racemase
MEDVVVGISVPYGGSSVTVAVPDANLVGVFGPKRVAPADEDAVLARALRGPSGPLGLGEFLAAGSPVVVVNDHTRMTPTAKVLAHLGRALEDRRPTFVVATGSHRAPTEDELRWILGTWYDRHRARTFVHDARDDAAHARVGVTERGTEVRLDRRVVEAERLLVIGSVEPHYFAGFTGGRKALLPGVAAYCSVEQNHALAMSPGSRALALAGNPVHEDMAEAAAMLADVPTFAVMTVLDHDNRIHAAAAGDLEASFEETARVAADVNSVRVPHAADVVVAVASAPLDMDLYQSQKAVEHARMALAEGGTLILVSACDQGIGPPAFVEIIHAVRLGSDAGGGGAGGHMLGRHKAAGLIDLMRHADLWAVTRLPDEVIEGIGARPFPSLQGALDAALDRNPGARVLFLMAASTTVPVIG